MAARLSSPQTTHGRGRVRLFALFLLKGKCTNADTLFSLFPKPQKSGSTSHVARSHQAGRGKGETQFGSGFGQVPRATVSLVRAASALCGTLEKGENVHFIYVFT